MPWKSKPLATWRVTASQVAQPGTSSSKIASFCMPTCDANIPYLSGSING